MGMFIQSLCEMTNVSNMNDICKFLASNWNRPNSPWGRRTTSLHETLLVATSSQQQKVFQTRGNWILVLHNKYCFILDIALWSYSHYYFILHARDFVLHNILVALCWVWNSVLHEVWNFNSTFTLPNIIYYPWLWYNHISSAFNW